MVENCTLYCRSTARAEAVRIATAIFGDVVVTGNREKWTQFVVRGTIGELQFTAKTFSRAGDDFARLQFSTYMHVDRCKADPARKQDVLSHITASELIIGVVANPSFEIDERYTHLVLTLAENLEGIIFNGDSFLNSNGETLLDV